MDNDDLLGKLNKEKEVAIEYQSRRHCQWKETYEFYRDIVETNDLTQRQEVNIPIMKETKKTLMSRIDDPPDVVFDCLEKGEKGREKEIIIEEIWQDDFDKCNFEAVDILEKNNVLLYGRTFKFLNFIDNKFSVEVPDNLDIVIDPKTSPIDIETARSIIRLHIYKPLREILADPKYTNEGKQELKKHLQVQGDEEGGGLIQFEKEKAQEAKDDILNSLGVENFDEFGAADVTVELNEHFTLIWDGKKYVRYVVIVAADSAILYKKTLKETLGIDFWPVISWADDVDTKDFWTDGIGDVVRTPNKVMNIYFSTMLENRVYRNLGMMWYLPAEGYNPQTFEPEPFGQYPAPMIADSRGGFLTVEQVIKQMDIPALEDNLVSIDFLIKLVERACYSEDTETLTENGWKYYWEVQDDEKIATFNPKKQKIEYHLPIKKYVYDYEGEMYHYHKDKAVDLLVSPEHKIWYRKVGHRKMSEWILKPANEIKENNIEFLIGADWNGKEKKTMILPKVKYLKQKKKNKGEIKVEMDTWLEFLGYVLSEGGMDVKGGFNSHYNLDIAQKDKNNTQKIRGCLEKLPFKFTERKDSKDKSITRFNIANKTLWIWLYQNIGAYCNEKRIPKEFKNLSKRQLKILFDAYMLGDGSIDERVNRNSGNALSVSKKLVDDLQEIGLKLGYKSKVIERQDKKGGNRKVSWRISFTFDNSVKSMITPELRLKKDLTIEKYKGMIYCFEVPNHLFVTRRNGLISIQGNTAATAIEKGTGEKKQITLGEVEELTAKASERIISIAKFYRRAWKEFAWKWRQIRELNASKKSSIKLYKKGVKGSYFEKEVYPKDWISTTGYKEKVMSSAEQEGEDAKGLSKLMLIAEKFPNNPAIQKLVQTRMLEMLDLTPDELRDVKQAEQQVPLTGTQSPEAGVSPPVSGPQLAPKPL